MRKWILEGFFLILLLTLSIGFYRVISPFVLDIFFSMVFVAISWPILLFYRKKWGFGPRLSSIAALFTDFLLVGIPLAILAVVFSVKTVGGIRAVASSLPQYFSELSRDDIIVWLKTLPFLDQLLTLFESSLRGLLDDLLSFGSQSAARIASRSVSGITRFFLHLFIMIFLMYFLFKDGEKLSERIRTLIPLSDVETDELAADLTKTTAATLVSTLLIGLIEGLMGGLLFIIFGLPSPVLFALLIVVISIIPVVGTNLILVPAGVIQILDGRIAPGVIIIVVGLVGVATTQNIIKPKLLGGRSGLHPALALLAIFGGIAWLGIIGFVIGPLLVSLFVVIWEQFGKRYKRVLSSRNNDDSVQPPKPGQ